MQTPSEAALFKAQTPRSPLLASSSPPTNHAQKPQTPRSPLLASSSPPTNHAQKAQTPSNDVQALIVINKWTNKQVDE